MVDFTMMWYNLSNMEHLRFKEKEVKEEIKKHALVTVIDIDVDRIEVTYTLYIDGLTYRFGEKTDNSLELKTAASKDKDFNPEEFEEYIIDQVFRTYIDYIMKNTRNTKITILA